MPAAPPSRGCLTAHFLTRIDLDYPCTLATTSSAEAAKSKRARELTATGEAEFEGRNKKKGAAAADAPTAENPMAADIPYVANITQATLEIKKSRLFIEKHEAFMREQQTNARIAAEAAAGGKPRRGVPKRKFSTREEEAAAAKEDALLADPLKAIEGARFVLNALPEIGNTGRPLAVCHFRVEEGHLVHTNNQSSSSSSTAAASSSSTSDADTTLAIVRMPIHMCTSVGRQGREEEEKDGKKKKKKLPDLAEGGSSGLAGLELVYVPRRSAAAEARAKAAAQKGVAAAAAADSSDDEDGEKKKGGFNNKKKFGGGKNNNNKNNKKGGEDPEDALFVDAMAGKRDVFPVAYFDVSVTIAGVQYTYLLHSQFDVLAGRGAGAPQ